MSKHISNGDILFATIDDIPEWMKLVDIVKENFPGLEKESYLATLRKNITRKTALCYKYNDIIAGILIFSTNKIVCPVWQCTLIIAAWELHQS